MFTQEPACSTPKIKYFLRCDNRLDLNLQKKKKRESFLKFCPYVFTSALMNIFIVTLRIMIGSRKKKLSHGLICMISHDLP